MNNALLLILSIIGFLALYWVLMGQWRYNKMLRDAKEIRLNKKIIKNQHNGKKKN